MPVLIACSESMSLVLLEIDEVALVADSKSMGRIDLVTPDSTKTAQPSPSLQRADQKTLIPKLSKRRGRLLPCGVCLSIPFSIHFDFLIIIYPP